MVKIRLIVSVLLALSLLPLDLYALALAGPDPNFPCGSHQCGCSSRKKCMSHCCCFPDRAKKSARPDQASIQSCGGMDDVMRPAKRPETLVVMVHLTDLEPERVDSIPAPVVYSSFNSEITPPPPRLLA